MKKIGYLLLAVIITSGCSSLDEQRKDLIQQIYTVVEDDSSHVVCFEMKKVSGVASITQDENAICLIEFADIMFLVLPEKNNIATSYYSDYAKGERLELCCTISHTSTKENKEIANILLKRIVEAIKKEQDDSGKPFKKNYYPLGYRV